jgi:hypothetical protein
MTGDGQDVYSMGAKAKDFEKASERHTKAIEKKDEEIAQLREQLRVVTAERDALKGSGASPAHKAGARVTRNQG